MHSSEIVEESLIGRRTMCQLGICEVEFNRIAKDVRTGMPKGLLVEIESVDSAAASKRLVHIDNMMWTAFVA